MRSQLLLLPVSALIISAPAHAEVFLSVEQAQALMFPGATFEQDFRALTDAQVAMIEKDAKVDVRSRQFKLWRVSSGGWFIVDEVVGKHDFIPFALALDAKGAILDIEILEYRESYGSEVMAADWRAQFKGKANGASLRGGTDIKLISGARLSSRHLTDGVRRLISTFHAAIADG